MSDTQVPLIDLHLMVASDGRERSLVEYDALFGQGRPRGVRTTHLDNGYVMIDTAEPTAPASTISGGQLFGPN